MHQKQSHKHAAALATALADAGMAFKALIESRNRLKAAWPIGSGIAPQGSFTDHIELSRLISHEVYRVSAHWRDGQDHLQQPMTLPAGRHDHINNFSQPEAIKSLVSNLEDIDDHLYRTFQSEDEEKGFVVQRDRQQSEVIGANAQMRSLPPAGTPTLSINGELPLVAEQPKGKPLTAADIAAKLAVPPIKMR